MNFRHRSGREETPFAFSSEHLLLPASASGDVPRSILLTHPILERNVRFPGEGVTEVLLWNQWPGMLSGLSRLGKLLVVSRNEGSILGHFTEYPKLPPVLDAERFFTPESGFFIDLRFWHQACVREYRHGCGWSYSIEIANPYGQLIHKICLTGESDFSQFLDWVQIHQGTGEEPAWHPGVSLFATESPRGLSPTTLAKFFHPLAEEKTPVQITVGNEGIHHSHTLVFEQIREIGDWLFCSNGSVGWHVLPHSLQSLELESRWWDEAEATLQIRALSPTGSTLFILQSGSDVPPEQWNVLARKCMKNLQS